VDSLKDQIEDGEDCRASWLRHNMEVQQLILWVFGNIAAEYDSKFRESIVTQSSFLNYLESFVKHRMLTEDKRTKLVSSELHSIIVYVISSIIGA
jgi:hypothetical protein